ncbi:MAG: hypothetical protein ACXQTN_05580, partial [Methanoculleaceae archaeon]
LSCFDHSEKSPVSIERMSLLMTSSFNYLSISRDVGRSVKRYLSNIGEPEPSIMALSQNSPPHLCLHQIYGRGL